MPLPPLSLLIAMAVMISAGVAAGVGIARFLRRKPDKIAKATALIGAGLLVLHALWLNGNPLLVRLLPVTDAVVWTNLSPLFVAILAAAAWRTMTVRWQRWLAVITLATICVTQAYGPLFGRVPPTRPARVVDGVHRQSTLSTCSAAAAATLLGTIGVETTETEMADLCLTRTGGTLQLGLYRGLRLKAPEERVEFINNAFDAVVTSPRPVIVSLSTAGVTRNPLVRRVGHSVVILGQRDGSLQIADPMTGGIYTMKPEEFRRVWAGEAMRFTH